MSDLFHPNRLLEKLKKAENAAGKAHFNIPAVDEYKVQIRADEKVSLGKFLPDPLIPGGYKAHPTTIRAMRKDIFTAGSDEFIDLEQLHTCHSCQKQLDLQFWFFCPYCEASIKI
jgi:hypothetical protein